MTHPESAPGHEVSPHTWRNIVQASRDLMIAPGSQIAPDLAKLNLTFRRQLFGCSESEIPVEVVSEPMQAALDRGDSTLTLWGADLTIEATQFSPVTFEAQWILPVRPTFRGGNYAVVDIAEPVSFSLALVLTSEWPGELPWVLESFTYTTKHDSMQHRLDMDSDVWDTDHGDLGELNPYTRLHCLLVHHCEPGHTGRSEPQDS